MTNSVVIAVQVEELAKDPGTSPGTKTLGDETYTAWKFNSSPLNMYQTPKGKDRTFQTSLFRGELRGCTK